MITTRLFENGDCQAANPPEKYRFTCDELQVDMIGDMIFLTPKESNWDNIETAVEIFQRISWKKESKEIFRKGSIFNSFSGPLKSKINDGRFDK